MILENVMEVWSMASIAPKLEEGTDIQIGQEGIQ